MSRLPKTIRFVQAGVEDFELLRELHRRAMYDQVEHILGWEDDAQEQRLRKHFDPRALQFIFLGEERIGSYSLQDRGADFHLSQFYLEPEHQRKGLGGIVLERILQIADQRGKPVRLCVLKRSSARSFYERHGFEHEGEDLYQNHLVWEPR